MTPYYQDSAVTIYHKDCREILPLLIPASVDLVLTDPPFKVSQKYGGGVDADNLMAVSSIITVLPQLSKVLKESRFAFLFYDNRILPFLFDAIKGTTFVYRKQLFLYRRWGNANRWVGWMQTTDPICVFVNGYEKPFVPAITEERTCHHDCYIKEGPEDYDSGHPAQKPIDLCADIISWCSSAGEIVLDPFMGSGTTLRAAKDLGRKAIGIEIEERYCEIAALRMSQEVLPLCTEPR